MDTVVLEVGESPSSVSHGPDYAGSLPGRCLPAGESTEARGGTDLRLGEGGPVPGTGEATDRSARVFSPGGHAIDRGGDQVRTVPFGPLVHEVHGADPLGILVGGPNPAGEGHQGRQLPPPPRSGRGGAESAFLGPARESIVAPVAGGLRPSAADRRGLPEAVASQVLVAHSTRSFRREDPRSHGAGVGGVRLGTDDVSGGGDARRGVSRIRGDTGQGAIIRIKGEGGSGTRCRENPRHSYGAPVGATPDFRPEAAPRRTDHPNAVPNRRIER